MVYIIVNIFDIQHVELNRFRQVILETLLANQNCCPFAPIIITCSINLFCDGSIVPLIILAADIFVSKCPNSRTLPVQLNDHPHRVTDCHRIVQPQREIVNYVMSDSRWIITSGSGLLLYLPHVHPLERPLYVIFPGNVSIIV
jgi:hypothetical protein